jgi:hypothetical protein
MGEGGEGGRNIVNLIRPTREGGRGGERDEVNLLSPAQQPSPPIPKGVPSQLQYYVTMHNHLVLPNINNRYINS